MKKYKGFTLAECVTALAVVVILSVIAMSICLMANNLTIKNNCLKFGLNECENFCDIFEKTDVGQSGENINALKANLLAYYNNNISFYENENLCNFEIKFDAKNLSYSNDASALISAKVYVENSQYITLGICIKNNDNIIYETETLFQKEYVNA